MGAINGLMPQQPVRMMAGGGVMGGISDGLSSGSLGPIGGLLGSAGGAGGTGFSSPQGATIQNGVTTQDTNQANLGAQYGIQQQQALLAALQSQNGIGNQASVFNQGQGLANQMGAANGVGKQDAVFGSLSGLKNQQQATAQQYQNIANGTGPNPAQAALNNATGQNVANQAALMAGQRGAGANVGLMARQAAQQGGALQQQAAGQGAAMQAQQQIAGLQGLSAQQQAIGNTTQAAGNLATSQVGAQQAQQGQLAAQAANQVGNQMGATTGLSQGQQGYQQNVLGALGAQNSANVSSQGNINTANAGMAQTQMAGQQKLLGGAGQAIGAIAGLANGGQVSGPASAFGRYLAMQGSPMAAGGLAQGGGAVQASSPGQTPVKKGDSYANDKIPTLLSAKEIVLPRSVTMSKDPASAAARFVQALQAKKRAS